MLLTHHRFSTHFVFSVCFILIFCLTYPSSPGKIRNPFWGTTMYNSGCLPQSALYVLGFNFIGGPTPRYVYAYIYIHVCICTHTYTHIHTCIYAYIYTYTHTTLSGTKSHLLSVLVFLSSPGLCAMHRPCQSGGAISLWLISCCVPACWPSMRDSRGMKVSLAQTS